jgi:hypothetical protein
MHYEINGRRIEYVSEGGVCVGDNTVLSQLDIDLTRATSWHGEGYTIQNLFGSTTGNTTFHEKANALLIQCWRDAGLPVDNSFNPEQYHRLVTTQNVHLQCVDKTKLLSIQQFPLGIQFLEERISFLMGEPLHVRNPFDDQEVFHFRVVRPLSGDNNPLHRDVWLEDYKDCINLYIPVAGSDEHSSLILAPGSHLWPESRIEKTVSGAIINGLRFNVPAVTRISGDYAMIRPNPAPGEVLIFSPYLIHGGAVNLNADRTRISLEVRLWRRT